MRFENGYGVSELATPTGYPLSPPIHPPQFQLFLRHQQQSLNFDPFALNFRAAMDPHFNSAAGNHLIGLSAGAGGLPPYVRPPPSLVVAPQPLRWSNHQEDEHPPPLWKCESVIGNPQFQKNGTEIQISAMETPPIYTQLGDQFGSKPEFEKQFSQSPGSASEIHETQWAPNPENEVIATREIGAATKKKKKKKKHNFCTDEEELERELNLISGFIEARLVAHQERLHQRFTAAIERMERVRKEREDTWRASDAEAYRAHAAARAREQALASTREAVIVSYLEKITGENIGLPRAETLIGSRTGPETSLNGPSPEARLWENINKYLKTSKDCDDESDSKSRVPVLKDDVTPPNSCLFSDNGDVHFESRRKKKKNEMLEAMLEVEESNAQAHQLNQMDDHDQEDCGDDM